MPVNEMDTVYNIIVSIKTVEGMLEIGTFFLGADADFAHGVFDSLNGDITSKDDALIRIDLEKKKKGVLPVRLGSMRCSLNQYAENCKRITLDIFKFFAFENEH